MKTLAVTLSYADWAAIREAMNRVFGHLMAQAKSMRPVPVWSLGDDPPEPRERGDPLITNAVATAACAVKILQNIVEKAYFSALKKTPQAEMMSADWDADITPEHRYDATV
jgi:hypothetical protein